MNGSGWIDLQVNGYYGVDFNSDDLTDQALIDVCRRLGDDGVASILATVITAPLDAMVRRISRLSQAIDRCPEVGQRLIGIHVEGPFINRAAGFVGAHPPDAVLPATVAAAQRLIDAGDGQVRLLTLAPESDAGFATTRWLADQGIVVAAGHSDASLAQLRGAIDQGLKLYTHLGNGCPMLMHRHDNIIQRVLRLADSLSISFIADGHHIPLMTLANYLRLVPEENVIIVSDAISAAGLGPGEFQLGDQIVHVEPDGSTWGGDRSHFAGSATTLPRMCEVLESLGIAKPQIERWLRDNPRRLLGLT